MTIEGILIVWAGTQSWTVKCMAEYVGMRYINVADMCCCPAVGDEYIVEKKNPYQRCHRTILICFEMLGNPVRVSKELVN